jgi:thiol:disulfide interchange protein
MANVDLDERGLVVACAACGKKNRLAYETLGAAVRCGQCKEPVAALGVPVELQTTADFDRLIAKSSLPVVVDYWAPWCGPCRMVAPELQTGRPDDRRESEHRRAIGSRPTEQHPIDPHSCRFRARS